MLLSMHCRIKQALAPSIREGLHTILKQIIAQSGPSEVGPGLLQVNMQICSMMIEK